MDNYVAALFLPHTDLDQFPKLKARMDARKTAANKSSENWIDILHSGTDQDLIGVIVPADPPNPNSYVLNDLMQFPMATYNFDWSGLHQTC